METGTIQMVDLIFSSFQAFVLRHQLFEYTSYLKHPSQLTRTNQVLVQQSRLGLSHPNHSRSIWCRASPLRNSRRSRDPPFRNSRRSQRWRFTLALTLAGSRSLPSDPNSASLSLYSTPSSLDSTSSGRSPADVYLRSPHPDIGVTS